MGNTLCEINLSKIDTRIKPCIIDFLKVKMKKYAKEFNWKYNDNDFKFVFKDKEMISIYKNTIQNKLTFLNIKSMNIKDLKLFLEYNQIDYESNQCIEKNDFVLLVQKCLISYIDEELLSLNTMSNKELIKLLYNYQIDSSSCIEKNDYIKLAHDIISAKREGYVDGDEISESVPVASAAAAAEE